MKDTVEFNTSRFDPKKRYTYVEALGPAMKIQTQSEADAYFAELMAYCMAVNKEGKTREEMEQIQKRNLAYYAGYFDDETRERVERLFNCAHPIFGKIAVNGSPTPEEAFLKGVEWGKKYKKKGK